MAPRWSRLIRMGPRELLHRGGEALHGWRERSRAGRTPDAAVLPVHAAEIFRQFCARPFFALDGADSRALPDAFDSLFPGARQRILNQAGAICRGEIRLFAQDVSFPSGSIDWHRDWKNGAAFPREFYRDLAWSQGAAGPSGKRVLELNRHQFLVSLGQAYVLAGEESYAQCAVQHIESWMAANPPYTGVNWKDALELALRLVSWLYTLRLIAGSAALNEMALTRILTSVALQRLHIERHNSLYSSPNTHLLGEALGLFVVGRALPELPGARDGAVWGLAVLETELRRQVNSDGAHAEQSAYYHAYALEMYLLATILGRQHGVSFSMDWTSRVERMAEYLMALTRPDGTLARFGDDDGGRTIRLSSDDYYGARPLLAVAAAVFNRADFRFVAGDRAEDVFWLLGPAAAQRYMQMAPREPATRAYYFGDAHVGVVRTGWGSRDSWVCGQAQPMGMLTAGHSHANILGVEISLAGQRIVVDPGTYCYGDHLAWREHFRGIAAHSVAQMAGARLPVAAELFRWADSGAVRPSRDNRAEDSRLEMGCEFATDTGTIRHIRRVTLDSPDAALVEDEWAGQGRPNVTTRFQFPPGAQVERGSGGNLRLQLGALRVRIELEGFESPALQIRTGEENPAAGWVSPAFDQRVPAPALEITEAVELPARHSVRFVVEIAGAPGQEQS